MSEPNLNSHQSGWYNPGEKLTLLCSKRGQAVKGFFSFNIPGGWDTLWYKTSDNNFVADVDIETGTLKDVTKDCDGGGDVSAPAAEAAPASPAGRTKGATTEHNPFDTPDLIGYCTYGAQEQVHGHAGYYISALTGPAADWAGQARGAGWTVVSDPQPRALVVFDAAAAGNPYGHVAWVDAVNGNDLTITEMNYGRGGTKDNGYHTVGFRQFDTRHIKSGPGLSYILVP
ncbi:CHAP domain-containing protein [Mycobacterium sp. OTB74]|uniref:CHAP domain-containing protein n=1 Tax=Mycobacterium sp. OTB74 TaxID=1853452 RepID=UPI0024735633|nr:CHAP domain-containing protein [Mycobacterium sp. OTB74]MDH6246843.1 surface antigen [Mycobacterium sp. OTB74]